MDERAIWAVDLRGGKMLGIVAILLAISLAVWGLLKLDAWLLECFVADLPSDDESDWEDEEGDVNDYKGN